VSELFRLVVAILAVYRVAHMLAIEDGPFDAFSLWRERVGQATWLGRGFHCTLCISFWLALPPAFVLGIPGGAWGLILGWLAIAGGVLVLYRLNGYET